MDYQTHRRDSEIYLGIAVQNAVMSVLTRQDLLRECMRLLTQPHQGLVDTKLGSFGAADVRLNLDHDDTVSIFIDGPDFDEGLVLSSGIWVDKEYLKKVIEEALFA